MSGLLRRMLLGLVLLGGFAGGAQAHGPLHESIRALDEEIARNPADAGLHVRRADLLRLDGDSGKAMADLADALVLSPGLAEVWWVRARVLLNEAQFEGALADLDRWLEVYPQHEGALVARAGARERTGDLAGAVEDYSLAIDVTASPDPDAILARARVQRQRGASFLEQALQGLDAGMVRCGNLVALELEAVDLEMALGRVDGALVRVDALLAQAARKESWYARRAGLLEGAHRMPEARAEWTRALSACLRLPQRLRQSRSIRELEERVRQKLSPPEIATVEAEVPSSPSTAHPRRQSTGLPLKDIRILPPHAFLTP